MRKFLILSTLIIILIAVSWFDSARCQVISEEEILKQYGEVEGKTVKSEAAYASPEIYGKLPDSKSPEGIYPADTFKITKEDTADSLIPFGYDLFKTPSEISPPSEVADLSDYILGPGDNIIIYMWGRVEKEYSLTVDRQGKIIIPKVGEMVVWGLTLDTFKSKVISKLSKSYTDFKTSVSLGKIRSIRIYLTGEVKKPGAYTASSLTTLFNALYLAGGPNIRGSMRDIKLIRNNRVESTLDLYDFLLKGDSKSDIRLSSGDAIFVPVAGPRATIGGEIKRPAIYELKGGEKISQLMELAGGTTASAFLDRIMLDRISPNDEREVIDLNLNRTAGEIDDIELVDGDILSIFSIYEMRRNVVAIAGMVKHPGYFERNDSTTLKSLIMQSELQPENVYYQRANLFRRYADQRVEIISVNLNDVLKDQIDYQLCDKDSLHVYSIDEIERDKYVYINGEVKKPGKYALYENMTAQDLIFLAGNLNKDAYQVNIELARADALGKINLQNINLIDSVQSQIPLHEDDHLFVRKMPDWLKHRLVTIEGAVRFPGEYALMSKSETLYDLIIRAGGFAESAFPKGTIFHRASISDNLERQNLSQIIENSLPLREDSVGNIRKVELMQYNPENMNRIIIDMDKIAYTEAHEGDIILQNDDYIYIPEIPSGISVMGAVSANGTIKFTPDKNVKYYIKRAGNFSAQADKKRTRLIKADGRVFSSNGTLGKQVEIGDAIIVPTEIKKDHDWLKSVSSIVSILGGVATTAFIIDKL